MPQSEKIFLESHNIQNSYTGFGQFNYWLIKKLIQHGKHYQFTVTAKNKSMIADFEKDVIFKKYHSLLRHKPFRIRFKYNIWHSLNQNSKVEPYYDIPYIMTIHDVIFMEENIIDEEEKKKKYNRLNNKIKRSNAIVFISEYAKKSTNLYFDIPKSIRQEVIYNGNPVVKRDPIMNIKLPVGLNTSYIFSIGQFFSKKNFHVLIGMLSKLQDIQLVIAGNNNTEYGKFVQEEIKKFKLEDRIYLIGKISEDEKHYYLQNCKAFAFPSLHEGFGLPPIEAMAYGKPIFLAKRSSLPEIGGDYSFYWNEFKASSMAKIFSEGIVTFESNKEIYKRELIQRSLKFDWDTTAKEYIKLYKEILT